MYQIRKLFKKVQLELIATYNEIRIKIIEGDQNMGQKGMDFKHKEVININDGKKLGFVQDVCADLETGTITSIIVPGSNKFMGVFLGGNEKVIQWENIKCIGEDVILVDV